MSDGTNKKASTKEEKTGYQIPHRLHRLIHPADPGGHRHLDHSGGTIR